MPLENCFEVANGNFGVESYLTTKSVRKIEFTALSINFQDHLILGQCLNLATGRFSSQLTSSSLYHFPYLTLCHGKCIKQAAKELECGNYMRNLLSLMIIS